MAMFFALSLFSFLVSTKFRLLSSFEMVKLELLDPALDEYFKKTLGFARYTPVQVGFLFGIYQIFDKYRPLLLRVVYFRLKLELF